MYLIFSEFAVYNRLTKEDCIRLFMLKNSKKDQEIKHIIEQKNKEIGSMQYQMVSSTFLFLNKSIKYISKTNKKKVKIFL